MEITLADFFSSYYDKTLCWFHCNCIKRFLSQETQLWKLHIYTSIHFFFFQHESEILKFVKTINLCGNRKLKTWLIINFPLANNTWLGATDWLEEGTWLLEPHGVRLNYTNFAPGQPNNYNTQNCLLMDALHNYQWNDLECVAQTRHHICKIFLITKERYL